MIYKCLCGVPHCHELHTSARHDMTLSTSCSVTCILVWYVCSLQFLLFIMVYFKWPHDVLLVSMKTSKHDPVYGWLFKPEGWMQFFGKPFSFLALKMVSIVRVWHFDEGAYVSQKHDEVFSHLSMCVQSIMWFVWNF